MKRLALICLLACGPADEPKTPASMDLSANNAAFDKAEDEVLHDLAAMDARLAARENTTPSEEDLRRVGMAAVLAEDTSAVIVEGRLDIFSFDARDRGLVAAQKKIPNGPLSPQKESERMLLARLVESERARVAEDRQLPRSASALVRAIVDTWATPSSPQAATERDSWLARRLGEIRTSMATSPLDVQRARELDDALDDLERITSGRATGELVKLREEIEKQHGPATPQWDLVAARLKAHLGITASAEAIESRLAAAEAKVKDAPGKELSLFTNKRCATAVNGSKVRSMTAAPERSEICAMLADPSPTSLHDHLVLAQWALAVAKGAKLSDARGKHHLSAPPSPDIDARIERITIARPVAAIGAGLAAALVLEGDPAARAAKWRTLGDVPLDVAENELR